MTLHQAPPRTIAKLIDTRLLRDQMHFNRMNVRTLADACGNPRYRSAIGHLHSGARNTCRVHLARRIEEALRQPAGALFRAVVVSSDQPDGGRPTIARGKRAA